MGNVARAAQYEAYSGATPPNPNFPDGSYMQVNLNGVADTCNQECWELWRIANREIQTFSAIPASLTPEVTRDLVERALLAIDRVFIEVQRRVVTRANATFATTFGGPAVRQFMPYPIRWPAESQEAMEVVLRFVAALHQLPHLSSNRLDNGLTENSAGIFVRPLFMLKESIMMRFFGMEPKGRISPNELEAMFAGSDLQPPLRFSFGDRRDRAADLSAESAAALTNESAPIPTTETIDAVAAGVEVWTWQPTVENWATFGEILARLNSDGPTEIPDAPFNFAAGGPIGGTPGGGSGGTPGVPGTTLP